VNVASTTAGGRPAPSIDTIILMVAGEFDVPVTAIQSKRRDQSTMTARWVAMWLARSLTRHSLVTIGARMGGRDHSTVLNAVRRLDGMLGTDPGLSGQVTALKDLLTLPPTQAAA